MAQDTDERRPRSHVWLRSLRAESHAAVRVAGSGNAAGASGGDKDGERFHWWVFGFTIFAGAYLLFQVEPLIGKFILPWFGGSPSVWTNCMLFFQVVLLAGYAYAHLSLARLRPAYQASTHVGLLLLALLAVPIMPAESWKPADGIQPAFYILALLLGTIGLPYFVLAATSPLFQAWFVRIAPGRSPYPLYALSNLGSLVALLSYPFFFEPYLGLRQQMDGWSWAFRIFMVISAWLAFEFRGRAVGGAIAAVPQAESAGARLADSLSPPLLWFLWLSLPAAASTILLAATNQLCQDVASVPFLWIVPLSLYLMSFILCFARYQWYRRSIFIPALVIGTFALVTALYEGSNLSLEWQIGIYSLGLFFCCMTCHGELYRLRPRPSRLTAFYLAIAAGGALGGLFVGLLAPLVFALYFEFHVGLFACCALTLLAVTQDPHWLRHKRHTTIIKALAVLALVILAGRLINQAYQTASDKTVVSRGFYGVLRVEERAEDEPEWSRRVLRQGAVDQGFQFLSSEKQGLPTAYYGPDTGVGLALTHLAGQRRIGLVGLGAGTLLAYGRPGDYFRIYEINAMVVEMARDYFSYLADTPASHEIMVADARLALEREPTQDFDLLILDAFSGDAIPMHLLTTEALALYFSHLRSNGVLVINISNHYLDLRPLMRGLAEQGGYRHLIVHSDASPKQVPYYASDWALLTRNGDFLDQSAIVAAGEKPSTPTASVLWTDDYSNLFRVLR